MNTQTLSQYLQQNIDWQRFVNLAASLGDQLNDAQWRFFKAIVFENSMETYSQGNVRYVGEEGCDLIVTDTDKAEHRVEMKYTEHALFTPKGKNPRDKSQSITLMNSKGTNTHKSLPPNYADFLLVVGLRGAALIDKSNLSKFVSINGDSITAQVPTSEMEFVFTPETVQPPVITEINLREEINEAVRRTISMIK